MPLFPNIQILKSDHDLYGLEEALRFPGDPSIRIKAAIALAELDSLSSVESLARSNLEDPEPIVKAAAHDALTVLLGTSAESTILYYRSLGPYPEPWIFGKRTAAPAEGVFSEEVENSTDSSTELSEEIRSQSETNALVTIIRASSDTNLKLKAIQELAKKPDMSSLDSLIWIAKWDGDDPQVQKAAATALKQLYGDDYQQVINAYQDEETDDNTEELEIPLSTSIQAFDQPDPVIHEEKSGLFQVLLIGILVIILVLIFVLLKFI